MSVSRFVIFGAILEPNAWPLCGQGRCRCWCLPLYIGLPATAIAYLASGPAPVESTLSYIQHLHPSFLCDAVTLMVQVSVRCQHLLKSPSAAHGDETTFSWACLSGFPATKVVILALCQLHPLGCSNLGLQFLSAFRIQCPFLSNRWRPVTVLLGSAQAIFSGRALPCWGL